MAVRIRRKVIDTRKDKRLRNAGKDESPLIPPRVGLPPAPTYDNEDRTLLDEQQVARVELLMMKGIRAKHQLSALLDIDRRSIDRYIERVIARWELLGASQDHARHRGEALSRLDLIESELWSRFSNEGDQNKSLSALRYLLELQQQRNELQGLTPKVIERIAITGEAAGTQFSKKVSSHERLSIMAARMLEKIAERTRVIDHDTAEDIDEVDD